MALSVETLALAKKFAKSYTDTAIAQLPNGVVYKGAVNYYSNLPANPEEGDAYTVLYQGSSGTVADGKEYVWGKLNNTLQWIPFGTDVDPSYRPFPDAWSSYTSGTISAFCAVVNADPNAVQGMAYLGELTCSDLPFSGNADAIVEIMDGTGTSGKAIHIVITSGDTPPYRWEYTYWNNGSRISGWIGFLPETVNITYTNLVALKNNSGLTPGCFYRITDYVTKINGTYDISSMAGSAAYVHYAKSAEHPFDIIVQALDENTLSENASAIQHDGDTYFANSDLSSWQLKYTVENDPTQYAWADTTNGKGVIYYMKDEFGNECRYDFKNIQYLAYAITYTESQYEDSLCYDASNQPKRYGSVYYVFVALENYMQSGSYDTPFPQIWHKDFSVGANILGTIQFPTVDATYLQAFNADWYYTFDEYDESTGTHLDKTLNSSGLVVTYDNVIGRTADALSVQLSLPNIPEGLPVNIFEYLSGENDGWCWSNVLGDNSLLNVFGITIATHTLTSFTFNVLGKHCLRNTFGHYCAGNSIGDGCLYNSFGNNYQDNSLGDSCSYNSFGNSCDGNSFGQGFTSNSFGNACQHNSFGDYCGSNSFGNSCNYNSFGNSCNYNSLGNNCYNNSIGDSCYYNSFGNECNDNSFDYSCYSNTVSENVLRIEMVNNTSPATTIGGYTILSGQYGVDSLNKYQLTISTPLASQNYAMYVGLDASGSVRVWNPAEVDMGIPYITTAPASDNTSGKLIFVVLASEPQTRYAGYYYIILGA